MLNCVASLGPNLQNLLAGRKGIGRRRCAVVLGLAGLLATVARAQVATTTVASFPSTAVGVPTASAPTVTVTFTFTNGGTLGTYSYLVLTQGGQSLDFQRSSTQASNECTNAHSYNVGDTCTVAVAFTPLAPGQRLGAVQLLSNSVGVVATALLSGTGTGPAVVFPASTVTRTLGSFMAVDGMAVDASGNAYVADATNHVTQIEAVGGSIPASNPTTKTLGFGFKNPGNVAVDGAGNVYVADAGNNAVKEIIAVGGVIPATNPTILTLGSGFSYPDDVKVDGTGNVFVLDEDHELVKEIVAVNGAIPATSPTIRTLGSGFKNPTGIAVDAAGNVYVTDRFYSAVKEMLAVNGSIPATNPTIRTLGATIANPQTLAVDAAGDVYVLGAGVVELVAVNGSVPATSATVLTLGTGFSLPHGVAVDGAGNVFVADYGNSAAKEIPLATPPSLSFATTPAGATSTDSPQSVTVQNIGSTALTFPVPSVGANPAFGTQSFSLANGGATTCPQLTSSYSSPAPTLATGASCTYGFTFVPTAVGTLVDSATLYDTSMNLSPATQIIALSGTATGDATPAIGSATISASPTTQTVGASSTVTVHVADAAGYGIEGSAVQVSSSGNATFQSSGTNTASGVTDSNGNLVVSLTDGTPETVTLSSPQVTGTTSVTFVPHSLVVTTTSDNPSPIDQCGSSPTNGPTACRAQVLMEALVACGQDGGTATPGSCSLRDATETAGVIGATNITFDPTVFATPQTIVLTYVTNNSVFPSGPFTVTDNTNITGPRSSTGANLLTLDGAAMAQILTFEGGTEAVSNLILQNGLGTGDQNGVNNGAAIYVDSGAVTLSGSTILNNNATGTAAAGGLYLNSGSLTILDSTFNGNTSSTNGGAIEVASGTLTVTNSTFGGNAATLSGGALYVTAGSTLSLSSSTVSANQGDSNSGGIFNGGTAVLQNSIVEGNTAPAYPDINGSVSSATGSLINTGNTTATPGLAALGSYGGPTPTMLPEPGSPALCAGVAGGAATDQRGFLAGLGGYCPIGAVDAGAVQTDYALAFSNIPASISAGSTFSPQAIASLTESGAPYTAGSPAITVGDTASPSALTGIYASTLGISQGTTASSDQLTATLALSASPPITLSAVSTSFTITTPVAPAQRITFPAPTPVVYGGGTIPLSAVASSGLAVSYTVSGPATLSGSTLTPTGPGVVVVTASQPGNGSYVAANPVTQTVSIAAPLGTASLAIGATSSPVTLKVAFANSFTLESIVPAVQAGAGSLSVSTGATGACAIGTPYTAGQSCTLSVTFTPSSAGLFAGVVQLDDGSSTVQATANVVSVRYR